MRALAERAWFFACRAMGHLLRAARYSKVVIVSGGGWIDVRKTRHIHAPLLVWVSGPLVKALDVGVRVLPQGEWEERERRLYHRLYDSSVRVDSERTLVLPFLPGETLAVLLESGATTESMRRRAIELSVEALVTFHQSGFTHGDAMAENVMVDLEAGVARWFDFETMHQAERPMAWRRADDLRALLATCLLRTSPADLDDVRRLVLRTYGDEQVTCHLARHFESALRRRLIFHLGQAPLSYQYFRTLVRLFRVT